MIFSIDENNRKDKINVIECKALFVCGPTPPRNKLTGSQIRKRGERMIEMWQSQQVQRGGPPFLFLHTYAYHRPTAKWGLTTVEGDFCDPREHRWLPSGHFHPPISHIHQH